MTLQGHQREVTDVKISRDNSFIVSGSRDRMAIIWDFLGNKLSTLQGHRDFVKDVKISRDNSFIVSGSRDGTAIIWENRQ